MPETRPITVIETPEFLSATRKLMTEDERTTLVDYMANNPTAGDLIPGPGVCGSCDGYWKGGENVAVRA